MSTGRPVESPQRSSGDGVLAHLLKGWIVLYLIPGVVLFLVRDHFARQEAEKQQQKEQQARQQQIQKVLDKVRLIPPQKMDDAAKILLGIEEETPKPPDPKQATPTNDGEGQ